MKAKKIRISRISALHYGKLVFRSVLFLAAVALYIRERIRPEFTFAVEEARYYWILMVIWAVYALEMVLRFFPSPLESMGCQKQFRRNFMPVENPPPPDRGRMDRGVVLVLLSWIGLNAAFGALYMAGVIDWGILLLVSLAYGVCDMICILFFCPFQTWMMKNKCCGSCRIYNWDYAMMFTPLLFVPAAYTWSLLGLAVLLVVKWEIQYALHPERFDEVTNAALRCENCPEKLCAHKKQLQRFLKTHARLVRFPLPPVVATTVNKISEGVTRITEKSPPGKHRHP